TPNNKAIFNVPIRTVTINHQRNSATYGAGGAITAGSIAEEEYKELVTKTKILTRKQQHFQLLETLALIHGEYILLEEHMERLKQSANYFQIPINITEIRNKLRKMATQYAIGEWRVRLTVSKQGQMKLSQQPLTPIKNTRITLAKKAINKEDVFHYHKTTIRNIYDQHKVNDDYFDVLLW